MYISYRARLDIAKRLAQGVATLVSAERGASCAGKLKTVGLYIADIDEDSPSEAQKLLAQVSEMVDAGVNKHCTQQCIRHERAYAALRR
jgi:hypothetical protein